MSIPAVGTRIYFRNINEDKKTDTFDYCGNILSNTGSVKWTIKPKKGTPVYVKSVLSGCYTFYKVVS